MSIENTHPEYDAMVEDYAQMRDTAAVQRIVKQAKATYLPPTAAQVLDGATNAVEPGYSAYMAYLNRAIFPEHVDEALRTMVGILNREPAEISVPARLEGILENATRKNETIHQLIRRINEAQLLYGRIGLLLDVDTNSDLPHIVTYSAESLINWDDDRATESARDALSFVVSAEDAWVRGQDINGHRQMFDWSVATRYRAMYLNENGVYATFTEQEGTQSPEIVPTFGGRPLDFVPFTFVGANDLTATPGPIPLLGISNAALAIYRGEADFRQTLHMLGQDTLVMTGVAPGTDLDEDEPTRIGSGAKIELPEGGDAKFIGISSAGLPEQRRALEDDYARSIAMGSRLLENTTSQAESGEALRIRVSAKTTTLHSVALSCAAGLEHALKQMAVWVGADPNEVRVSPNTDFVEDAASPEQALKLVEARNAGLPISLRSIHEWSSRNEFTQKSWEEELELIKEDAEFTEAINAGATNAAATAAEATVAPVQAENIEEDEQPSEED